MWGRIRDTLQHWMILIVGLVLISAGLLFGTQWPSSNAEQTSTASSTPAAAPKASPPPQQAAAKTPAPQVAASAPKQPPAAAAPPPPASPAPTPGPVASAPAASTSMPMQGMPAHTMPMPTPAPMTAQNAATPPPPAASGAPAPQQPAMPAAVAGAGDPTAGRLVFRKCQACHSMEPGKNILGPSLSGVIGHKAGSVEGYSYSPAMKGANITWDAATLDRYLSDPAKVVPGNKMPFPGLKTDHDRADVIAYMAAGGTVPQAAAKPSQQTAQQATPSPSAPSATPA